MTTSEFISRCLQPDEWRLLKALRLRALDCNPQSYWETVDEASARDDMYWNTFASKVTTPEGARMFIVEDAESVAAFVPASGAALVRSKRPRWRSRLARTI